MGAAPELDVQVTATERTRSWFAQLVESAITFGHSPEINVRYRVVVSRGGKVIGTRDCRSRRHPTRLMSRIRDDAANVDDELRRAHRLLPPVWP